MGDANGSFSPKIHFFKNLREKKQNCNIEEINESVFWHT